MSSYKTCVLLFLLHLSSVISTPEEDEGVKYADQCEVCKVLAKELEDRLAETGKTSEVLETGYALDDVKPKVRTEYKKSELRLVETLDGICERILKYNIHKERKDSTRFAKGMSETFQTLHGLVNKGVKVDLGIPYELWDSPSAEITNMKTQCETLLEQNEEDIERWYSHLQGTVKLTKYLCEDRYLKGKNTACLYEELKVQPKLKGETGKKTSKTKQDEL